MLATVGWLCAVFGLGLGLLLTPVPGIPGVLVAWAGLGAYLGLLHQAGAGPPGAFRLATLVVLATILAKTLSSLVGVRLVSRAGGAATGAALVRTLGAWLPLPIVSGVLGILGVTVGTVVGPGRWWSRLAVPFAIVPALLFAFLADLLGVMALAGLMAIVASGVSIP